MDDLNQSVEASRSRNLVRHARDNVLEIIHDALPPQRQEAFRAYRRQWTEIENSREAPAFPLNLYIEPVSNCNLRCVFCVRSRDQWRQQGGPIFSNERLGCERYRRIIDEGVAYGLPAIWFGASGEALLEDQTPEMIAYASRAGIIDTIMITNGQLLDEDTAARLIDIPLTRLTVSIDAFSEATYRKLRGGDYARLMRNLDGFLALREGAGSRLPILRVSFVEMAENRHEKEAFIQHWTGRADMVDVQRYWDFDVNDAGIPERNRQIQCTHPWKSLFIMAGGDVYPCCSFYAMREHYLGNVEQQSLAEIWNSERLAALRESLTNGRYRDACKLCYDAANPESSHE
jgi:radical SAM protein with 4Fe4S-binding SPASM domain